MRTEIVINDPEQFNASIKNMEVSSIFVIVDENTKKYCLPLFTGEFKFTERLQVLEVPSGEINKTIEYCGYLWEELGRRGADRKSLIINLGGGVICDMGGFVASTFKRGVRYIHVPTTLLAMADAAIGGKCGVDFKGIKNQIGLFGKPEFVFINPEFLNTLPERQCLSGYSEIVKISLTSSDSLWQKLMDISPSKYNNWQDIIIEAIKLKQSVTSLDPFESGPRKLLNFGHTVGHAVESYFLNKGHDILHGEAVAFGILAAAKLSVIYTGMSEKEYYEIKKHIKNTFIIPVIKDCDIDEIVNLMKHDKKNVNGKFKFTLLEGIGRGVWDIGINEETIRNEWGSFIEPLQGS